MNDEKHIQRTFELALKGLGSTWPNPLVGAVLVKDGRVIGEGFHEKYGGPHAEVRAFENCTESPAGATLYVNLEPCCHTKKQTPPCTLRVIKEGIKKVIIANLDPNPAVNGQGVELLRQNGIEVEHGVLASEGEKLNEVFFHSQKTKRPFVYLKMATTLDGKIALSNGESQWITGEKARYHVHELRAQHQAIMIGAETLRKDNPRLNVRLPDYRGEGPLRLVLTRSGSLPPEARLFTDELKHKTLVYTFEKLKFDFPASQVIMVSSLHEVMNDLFERKIVNVFLEGGKTLATSFMRENLINRAGLYLNPSFLGSGLSALDDLGVTQLQERPRLTQVTSKWLGEDLFMTGLLTKDHSCSLDSSKN